MREKLKAFWNKLNADINELWQNDKIFVILFGLIILVIKFRQILIDIIVSGSKRLFENTQKSSDESKAKEDDYNSSAEKLIEDAESLGKSNPPVGDDWYKK